MNQNRPKQTDHSEPPLMTTFEAAAWLRLSPGHLMNMRSQGTGPHFCRLNRSIRYCRSNLQEWIENRRVKVS
jgi:predicted DNA-binding transcriptional regulator AlpA